MKNLKIVLGSIIALFIMSCEGPQGPAGFDGLDGRNGANGADGAPGVEAQIFEVDGLNLDYDIDNNIWSTIINFRDYTSLVTLKEDVILVYRFDEPITFQDGEEADAWGLLPQNFFLDQGIMQYVTSHTLRDVNIIIDGNFNLNTIATDFTDNQLFRVAILPGVGAPNAKLDTSSFAALMASLDMTEADVKKFKAN